MLDKSTTHALAQKMIIIVSYKDDKDLKHGWIYLDNIDTIKDENGNNHLIYSSMDVYKKLSYNNMYNILIGHEISDQDLSILIKLLLNNYNKLIFCYTNFPLDHLKIINNQIIDKLFTNHFNNKTDSSEIECIEEFNGRLSLYFKKEEFNIQFRLLKSSYLLEVKKDFLNYIPVTYNNINYEDDAEYIAEEEDLKLSCTKAMKSVLTDDYNLRSFFPICPLPLKDLIRAQYFKNATFEQIVADYTPKAEKENINER